VPATWPHARCTQVDDYISPITVEIYTDCRMRTLLDSYEQEAPGLARLLRLIETVAILFTTSATLLASMDMEVILLHDSYCTHPRMHARTARQGTHSLALSHPPHCHASAFS
jgi:hypothetical protein